MNAGLITENCIEEAREEIGRIVQKKNTAKPKLLESQQKLSMGLKKKSELNVELRRNKHCWTSKVSLNDVTTKSKCVFLFDTFLLSCFLIEPEDVLIFCKFLSSV